jgi:hypothetical protein
VPVPSIATASDLVARLGRDLSSEESVRVEALLADASAMIRAYTGQDFAVVLDDVVILRVQGGTLQLPQRPVIEVSRIEAIGAAGTPDVVLVDWVWDGIDQVRLGEGNYVINLPEIWWDDDGYPGTYRVTYSHGHAQPPADVVAVACAMVLRTLTSPAMAGGLTSETVGPYSYRTDTPGLGLTVTMSDTDRQALKRYRRTTGTITTRVR